MISLTKIFRFEAAHAIYGYPGPCSHIHGHSYELHVTVAARRENDHYIAPPGMIIDLKELKKIISDAVIERFDHTLLLSNEYIKATPVNILADEFILFDAEPTVENLLFYIQSKIIKSLPEPIKLLSLKLYETRDSYAEWSPGENQA